MLASLRFALAMISLRNSAGSRSINLRGEFSSFSIVCKNDRRPNTALGLCTARPTTRKGRKEEEEDNEEGEDDGDSGFGELWRVVYMIYMDACKLEKYE